MRCLPMFAVSYFRFFLLHCQCILAVFVVIGNAGVFDHVRENIWVKKTHLQMKRWIGGEVDVQKIIDAEIYSICV